MYYAYDSTYILILIAMGISMIAQHWVRSTFNKYSQLQSKRNITGKQAAEIILQANNIQDVRVEHVSGFLTDHYDPTNKVLRLSDATYDRTSISAVAVAAHECGHALQDAADYHFMRLRAGLVPIVNFTSRLSMPLILFGLILGYTGLINMGILAFGMVLVFQLVTLPVEFNASNRALQILDGTILTADEISPAKKVLRAAAFTYIAAALGTALQLLRFILISRRRD